MLESKKPKICLRLQQGSYIMFGLKWMPLRGLLTIRFTIGLAKVGNHFIQ